MNKNTIINEIHSFSNNEFKTYDLDFVYNNTLKLFEYSEPTSNPDLELNIVLKWYKGLYKEVFIIVVKQYPSSFIRTAADLANLDNPNFIDYSNYGEKELISICKSLSNSIIVPKENNNFHLKITKQNAKKLADLLFMAYNSVSKGLI